MADNFFDDNDDELSNAWREYNGIQSVLFPVNRFSESTARLWLKEHDMLSYKIDITTNFLRFRQRDPQEGEIYRIKILPDKVRLVIAYIEKPRRARGRYII